MRTVTYCIDALFFVQIYHRGIMAAALISKAHAHIYDILAADRGRICISFRKAWRVKISDFIHQEKIAHLENEDILITNNRVRT